MEYKLLKDIFLLSLHISKNKKVYVSTGMMSYTLIGAVFYEMLDKELISFKNNQVILNETLVKKNIDSILLPFIAIIEKTKNKSIKNLTTQMVNHSRELIKSLLIDLEQRGIIKTTKNKILGFIPYSYRLMINTTYLDNLLIDLRSVLYSNRKLNFYYVGLFSLIKSSKLEKKLSKNKQEQKHMATLISKKAVQTEVSKEVNKAFQDMQTVLTTLIITSYMATLSTSK